MEPLPPGAFPFVEYAKSQPFLPLERVTDGSPVEPDLVDALAGHLEAMFEQGWNDQEIVNDLSRINGVTNQLFGRMFGTKHLVALIRAIRDHSHGHAHDVPADRPERSGRPRRQRKAKRMGVDPRKTPR
jgi:hypothetical protein